MSKWLGTLMRGRAVLISNPIEHIFFLMWINAQNMKGIYFTLYAVVLTLFFVEVVEMCGNGWGLSCISHVLPCTQYSTLYCVSIVYCLQFKMFLLKVNIKLCFNLVSCSTTVNLLSVISIQMYSFLLCNIYYKLAQDPYNNYHLLI